jgi:hypothetical protein
MDTIKQLGFIPERGTGQGDIPSPLLWVGVFDILLTALDTVQDGQLFAPIGDGASEPVRDSAYADDLLSVVTTLPALQRKADIVSAFCLLFGIDLSVICNYLYLYYYLIFNLFSTTIHLYHKEVLLNIHLVTVHIVVFIFIII